MAGAAEAAHDIATDYVNNDSDEDGAVGLASALAIMEDAWWATLWGWLSAGGARAWLTALIISSFEVGPGTGEHFKPRHAGAARMPKH